MKFKTTLFFLSFFFFCFISCQNEINKLIQPLQNEVLNSSSQVTLLVKNTVTNDGSKDNIIDNASCITVKLPVNVIANEIETVVNVEEDYNAVEAIFDAFSNDVDSLQIIFPIVIILNDFSEITIYNYDDLNEYSENCNGDNEHDDDIECLDFVYPIYLSVFNSDSQITQTVTIESDEHFYNAIEDIEDSQIIEIQFPITTILYDGTEKVINDMSTLKNTIEEADEMCDEDDDNDYNDDDCVDCSNDQISNLLKTCSWEIHELINEGVEITELYDDYLLTFLENGIVKIRGDNENEFEGTWSVYTSNFQIIIEINFNNYSDFSFDWVLYEVEDNNEIYLKYEENEIELEQECD